MQTSSPVNEESYILSADSQSLSITEENDSKNKHKSTIPFASFNYINSIIGSGIIAMPYAFRQAGIGLGIILLIVVALVTDYSLILIIRGGLLSNTNSYQGLVETAFGRPGFYMLSIVQFSYPFIGMISYNVIIGDTITKVLIRVIGENSAGILGNRIFVVSMVTLLITVPLSLYRQLSKLAKVSLVSLVFVAVLAIAILIRLGTSSGVVPKSEDAWQFANTGVIQAVGVMAFAFVCHHNSFLIFETLHTPTQGQWNKVTHISVFAAFLMLFLFAILGYATFTGWTQGDLLENYCLDDDLMNASRIIFSITIMLTYPFECFVSREVIENIFFSSFNPKPMYLHVSITLFVAFVAFFVSLSTDCLGIVLELNGILTAVPLAYIMPAMCYLKLEPSRLFSFQKLPAFLTALFGIIVAISGFIVLVLSRDDYKCSHGIEMPYCIPELNTSVATNFTGKLLKLASPITLDQNIDSEMVA